LFEDNFDYVFALHTDEGKGKSPNPHVHLTIRAKGHDGTKLEFGPADLLYMRRLFATELRHRGIDADATPQIARGPRYNNEHSKTHQAGIRVEKNNNDPEKPWQVFERDVRRMEGCDDRAYIGADVVKLYGDLIDDLRQSRDPKFGMLARDFAAYVNESFGTAFDVGDPKVDVSVTPVTAERLRRPNI
jgi:hypothetical protein